MSILKAKDGQNMAIWEDFNDVFIDFNSMNYSSV